MLMVTLMDMTTLRAEGMIVMMIMEARTLATQRYAAMTLMRTVQVRRTTLTATDMTQSA
jgi:hypothetical protein